MSELLFFAALIKIRDTNIDIKNACFIWVLESNLILTTKLYGTALELE